MKSKMRKVVSFLGILSLLVSGGCANQRMKNQAKEAAARYWQDKAYPGKAFDIQVVEAEKAENGLYRVRGIVDGEARVGTYSPESETFSEGYYSLAHEREKRIAELEQELKYWKEKFEASDKEIYKLKVRLDVMKGKKIKTQADEEGEEDSETEKSQKKTGK
jgi:hypothetical protein